MNAPPDAHPGFIERIGFVLGPALMLGWLALAGRLPLGPEAHGLAGILILTIVWWVTEPIPIAATGLLAIVLCVILGAVPPEERTRDGVRTVLAPFADPTAFFLLGGLFIGRAMMKHGLDRRFALMILSSRFAARSPAFLLFTVGGVTTSVSMWVSNTATTAMMCPVVVGMVGVLGSGSQSAAFPASRYASALLLMVAIASSVGGIATPIGTATNVFAIGFLKRPEVLGRGVDFLQWMALGTPMMLAIFAALFAWRRISISTICGRIFAKSTGGSGHGSRASETP